MEEEWQICPVFTLYPNLPEPETKRNEIIENNDEIAWLETLFANNKNVN